MDPAKTTAIDLVEAGYNLELGAGDWLPNLDATGKSLLDLGLGFYSQLLGGVSEDGQPLITQMHVGAGPEDLASRFSRAAQAAGPELVAEWFQVLTARGVG